MKLILTIETFKSGEKNGIGWASATGVDAVGRKARAAFRDPREGDGRKLATAIVKQIGSLLSDGQDVSDIKPVVECLGNWRDRQISRGGKLIENNGKPVMERYFETASFSVLSGPALELRRTKLRAAEIADQVKAAIESGDTARAAEMGLEFLNAFSGRPADEDIDDDGDEPAAPEVVDATREEAAAAPAAETVSEVATVVEGEVVSEVAGIVQPTKVEAQAPSEVQALGGEDLESLVAAVEAAPPVHPEIAAEVAAKPVAVQAAPVRPDLGRPPVVPAAGVRGGVMPRPVVAASPLPSRAPVAAPAASPAGARPAPVRPQVQGGVAPRPVVAVGGVRPPVAPRPVSPGYREPAAGEDPEALAGAVLSKVSRPGMPPVVRTPPSRPGAR